MAPPTCQETRGGWPLFGVSESINGEGRSAEEKLEGRPTPWRRPNVSTELLRAEGEADQGEYTGRFVKVVALEGILKAGFQPYRELARHG